jgi:vacuolar-type H+-ATPase subunit H
MDVKEALDKIKEVELEAQGIIAAAQTQLRLILTQARQEREKIFALAQQRARKESAELSETMQRQTQQEITLIKKETEDLSARLIEKAQGNLDRAVEFLKDKIRE